MLLSPFSHPRLPLGTPVLYAGLRGSITGRTFGRLELYDLEVNTAGHRHRFPELAREDFTIDLEELARE